MEILKRKLPAFIIVLTLTLSIILMIPSVLFAQTDEEAVTEEAPPVAESLLLETTVPSMQNKGGEAFTFSFDLVYEPGDNPFGIAEDENEKTFDVSVTYPEGWYAGVALASATTEISAINLKFNTRQTMKLVAGALVEQEPGEYEFTVTFKSAVEGDPLEGSITFTAVITGTYEIVLTTKTGRLSTDLTAGKDNSYTLVLTNNSSVSVENITLTSTEPEGWQVDFDSKEIESVAAGEVKEIEVTINPPEKTIAGDYMLTFNASSENSNTSIELRTTVETPTIWGIVGIGIIVVVIIGIAIIFTRLGRR